METPVFSTILKKESFENSPEFIEQPHLTVKSLKILVSRKDEETKTDTVLTTTGKWVLYFKC